MLSHARGTVASMKRGAWLWLIPLLCFAHDAWAWGLYTHVFFAQWLTWALPLADPALRRAVRRYPRRVMAGACLPDLALLPQQTFSATHRWEEVHRLVNEAGCDEARATAVGIASHLWLDILAHHHFVPAHEHLWWDVPMLTHAAAEWAMDAHLARQTFMSPGELLRADPWLVDYVSDHFYCTQRLAGRSLRLLGRADAALRALCLPELIHAGGRRFDRHLEGRFDYYLAEGQRRLKDLNRVLAGETPAWRPDPARRDTRPVIARHPRHVVAGRLPLPDDYFAALRGASEGE